jgi:predicted cupin superfamily sugar epimerase
VLLHPDGRHEVRLLGGGAGQPAQSVVPAGTWMGARVAPGGAWSLFGTTMAPGFVPADYEGGEVEELVRGYPECEGLIRALCRADGPRRMPGDLHGGPDGDLDGDLDGGDSVRAAE